MWVLAHMVVRIAVVIGTCTVQPVIILAIATLDETTGHSIVFDQTSAFPNKGDTLNITSGSLFGVWVSVLYKWPATSPALLLHGDL